MFTNSLYTILPNSPVLQIQASTGFISEIPADSRLGQIIERIRI
jgi:hypothetical protein